MTAPRDPFLYPRGIKMPKHPTLTTGMVRRALREGTYERREAEAVLATVGADDHVLELGGGIGFISTLMAVKRTPRQITVYEPNPGLHDYIRSVHAANGVSCATLCAGIVAARTGPPVPFYVRRNLLASSLDRMPGAENIVHEVMVDQAGVADVIATVKPTVLVCDIEGAEAHVLKAGDWSGLRAAIIELHPQLTGPSGVRAVFEAMHASGLTYFPKRSDAKVVTFLRDW